jgi:hypothetical protein
MKKVETLADLTAMISRVREQPLDLLSGAAVALEERLAVIEYRLGRLEGPGWSIGKGGRACRGAEEEADRAEKESLNGLEIRRRVCYRIRLCRRRINRRRSRLRSSTRQMR